MFQPPFDWLLPLVAAPFVGSFLSVLAVRLPKGEDVVWARSRCRSCRVALRPLDLIPVVSWLAQGGKCRACGASIGWIYPAVETAAAGAVVWASFVVRGEMVLISAALGWALIALIATDLRAFILADMVTLALIPTGLAVAWWVDPASLHWHVLGAAFGFALLLGIAAAYRAIRGREGLGLGDAKLMAAAGAWTGIEGVGTVLIYGAIAGLALALALRLSGAKIDEATPIPLGAGLAAGIWLVWLYGPVLLAA